MTQREFCLKNDLMIAYAPPKKRQKATQKQKQTTSKAISTYNYGNTQDDGGRGRSFEIDFRYSMIPNSSVMKTQRQFSTDTFFTYKGKAVRIECKTGGGALAEGLGLTKEEYKKDWTPRNGFKFDYLAYCFEYNANLPMEDQVLIFSKTAFIKFLNTWTPRRNASTKANQGWRNLLTYKENEGRVMIANPRAGLKQLREKTKKPLATTPLYDFWSNYREERFCPGVYTLEQFKKLVRRA
jgi:hypothetical protein